MRSILAPGYSFEDDPLSDPAVLVPRVQDALEACEDWDDLQAFCAATRSNGWPVSFACGHDCDHATKTDHYLLMFHCDGKNYVCAQHIRPNYLAHMSAPGLAEKAVVRELARMALPALMAHLVP